MAKKSAKKAKAKKSTRKAKKVVAKKTAKKARRKSPRRRRRKQRQEGRKEGCSAKRPLPLRQQARGAEACRRASRCTEARAAPAPMELGRTGSGVERRRRWVAPTGRRDPNSALTLRFTLQRTTTSSALREPRSRQAAAAIAAAFFRPGAGFEQLESCRFALEAHRMAAGSRTICGASIAVPVSSATDWSRKIVTGMSHSLTRFS